MYDDNTLGQVVIIFVGAIGGILLSTAIYGLICGKVLHMVYNYFATIMDWPPAPYKICFGIMFLLSMLFNQVRGSISAK